MSNLNLIYKNPYANLPLKNFSIYNLSKSSLIDNVCLCKYTKGLKRIRDPKYNSLVTFAYEYYITYGVEYTICNTCNKIEILSIHKCKSCLSLFCKVFKHPKYHWRDNPICWHCLQDKYYDESAIPPPNNLLQPKAKILTMSERIAEVRALLAE